MNRRSFFTSLIATATLDPEKLLWVPGRKLISIPAPMIRGNSFLMTEWISEECLRVFQRQLVIAREIDMNYLGGENWA